MKILYEDYISEIITPNDIDLSGFDLKSKLCPDFWNNGKLDPYTRKKLLEITRDILDDFEIKDITFKDVIVTGSIANYNWNEDFSDIDLHIIIDFSKVDDDVKLVKKYFDVYRKVWNENHKEISIHGYPVEVYIQDVNEEHVSTGIYSIMSNDWLTEPSNNKLSSSKLNLNKIKETVSELMNKIDELQDRFDDNNEPEEINSDCEKLFDKIKSIRNKDLSGNTEMNDGNLIFKTLRRNGYIGKLLDIKTASYNRAYSLT